VKAKWRREEVLTSFDEKEKKFEKNFVPKVFSGRYQCYKTFCGFNL
jgi:hypothetical protein